MISWKVNILLFKLTLSFENFLNFSGVRSMLVEKDQQPKWNPSKIEKVSDEDIEKLFSPILKGFELQTEERDLLFM